MRFKTESGSTYEIRDNQVRRLNEDYTKRADGEWIRLLNTPEIMVGASALLVMESLHRYGPDDSGGASFDFEPNVTQRVTSRVVELWV